ncbi:acid sphingomyelinase-like phosphodiesterase 3b, partial [Lingula anatina]|uniref:Sphingomyelinase phosphodiesterase n=1 Tax=Lingula anatina TaxID=7574 RepID=A0A1S3KBE4_LINAN
MLTLGLQVQNWVKLQFKMASRMYMYTVLMLVGLVSVPKVIADIGSFWHVTDFHYDSTVFTSQDSCTSPVADIEQKPYGDYLCDSPWSLINSSVHAMKQIEPNADFILWTGDNAPHIDESKDSSENIINIISNLTSILMDVFPNTKVYAAHGNHDYFPHNQLPPHENEIYHAAANMWQRWHRDSTANTTLRKGGYYMVSIKQGLVAVVLNTNLYYNSNKVTADISDPAGQFQWFDQVLDQAAQNGNKAYVIAHIPTGMYEEGDSMIRPQFNKKLNDLIIKHKNTIAAMFYGHHHTDTFKLWYDQDEPVAFGLVAPSVTPWRAIVPAINLSTPAHNPGIRLLRYDRLTFQLKDIWQYYLELPDANDKSKAQWKLEYKFSEAYGVHEITSASLAQLVSDLEKKTDVFMKYFRYNIVSAKGESVPTSCDTNCQRLYICSIKEVDDDRHSKCVKPVSSNGFRLVAFISWDFYFLFTIMI